MDVETAHTQMLNGDGKGVCDEGIDPSGGWGRCDWVYGPNHSAEDYDWAAAHQPGSGYKRGWWRLPQPRFGHEMVSLWSSKTQSSYVYVLGGAVLNFGSAAQTDPTSPCNVTVTFDHMEPTGEVRGTPAPPTPWPKPTPTLGPTGTGACKMCMDPDQHPATRSACGGGRCAPPKCKKISDTVCCITLGESAAAGTVLKLDMTSADTMADGWKTVDSMAMGQRIMFAAVARGDTIFIMGGVDKLANAVPGSGMAWRWPGDERLGAENLWTNSVRHPLKTVQSWKADVSNEWQDEPSHAARASIFRSRKRAGLVEYHHLRRRRALLRRRRSIAGPRVR